MDPKGLWERVPTRRRPRGVTFPAYLTLAIGAVACGGSVPLVHPAHPLEPEQLSAGAGVSGLFLAGEVGEVIRAQNAQPEGNVGEGTAAHGALAPALAPWFGMRVGLDHSLDGGLALSGRSVRADLRHVWDTPELALSAGLGGDALLSQQASRTSYLSVGGVDTGSTKGWGFDIPLLFGARTDARSIEGWVGTRLGYQHSATDLGLPVAASPSPDADGEVSAGLATSADDVWAGAVLGVALGVAPVWLVFEAQGSHHWLWGSYESAEGRSRSFSLTGIAWSPTVACRVETW